MTEKRKIVASSQIAESVKTLVQLCHGLAYDAGWWEHQATGIDIEDYIRNPQDALHDYMAKALVAQKLCLVHSEISEAMEGHRKGKMDDHLPHRSMLEVELADAVIRIADLAGAMNLDLGGAIVDKLQYNASREDHKPENRIAEGGKKY